MQAPTFCLVCESSIRISAASIDARSFSSPPHPG